MNKQRTTLIVGFGVGYEAYEGVFPSVSKNTTHQHFLSTYTNVIQFIFFLIIRGELDTHVCYLQDFIISYLSGLNFQEKTLGPAGS